MREGDLVLALMKGDDHVLVTDGVVHVSVGVAPPGLVLVTGGEGHAQALVIGNDDALDLRNESRAPLVLVMVYLSSHLLPLVYMRLSHHLKTETREQ